MSLTTRNKSNERLCMRCTWRSTKPCDGDAQGKAQGGPADRTESHISLRLWKAPALPSDPGRPTVLSGIWRCGEVTVGRQARTNELSLPHPRPPSDILQDNWGHRHPHTQLCAPTRQLRGLCPRSPRPRCTRPGHTRPQLEESGPRQAFCCGLPMTRTTGVTGSRPVL